MEEVYTQLFRPLKVSRRQFQVVFCLWKISLTICKFPDDPGWEEGDKKAVTKGDDNSGESFKSKFSFFSADRKVRL